MCATDSHRFSYAHVLYIFLFCIQEAEALLTEMENKLKDLQAVSDSVAEYFCEDPSEFKLDECCSIFHSFCERFLRAMQVSFTSGRFKLRKEKKKQNPKKKYIYFCCRKTGLERWQRCSGGTGTDCSVLPSDGPPPPVPAGTKKWKEWRWSRCCRTS